MGKLLEKTLRAVKWGAIAIASTFIANQALSQSTGTLTGKATYSDDGTIASNVKVTAWQRGVAHSTTTDQNGNYTITNLPTSVNKPKPLPEGYEVPQNYPNPFNQTTKIQVIVPKMSNIDLDVYNIIGQLVLHKAISAQPGTNIIEEELPNDATGVYIARITIDKQYTKTLKEIHLKGNNTITNSLQFSEPTQSGKIIDPTEYTPQASTHSTQSMNGTESTNSGVGIDSLTIDATKASNNKTGNAKKTIKNIPIFNGTFTENLSIEKTYLMNGKIYNLWKWEKPDSNSIAGARIIIDNTDTTFANINGQYETSITEGTHTANITAPNYYERNTAIEMTPTNGKITKKHNFNIADKTNFPTNNMDKHNQQWRASEWPNTQPIHGNTRWDINPQDRAGTQGKVWIDTTYTQSGWQDTLWSIVKSSLDFKTPVYEQGVYDMAALEQQKVTGGEFPYDTTSAPGWKLMRFRPQTGAAQTGTDRDFAHNNVDKVIYGWTTFKNFPQYTGSVNHEAILLQDGGIETFPDSTPSALEAPVRPESVRLTTFDKLARLFRYSRTIGNNYIQNGCQDNDKGLDPEADDTNR